MADLTLPTPNKTPGDGTPAGDTNLIIEAVNTLNSAVEGIPAGPQGPQGEPGTPGAAGANASVTVGNTNTGVAGSDAVVSNSGTAQNAVFNFTIPRGNTGATGATGSTGSIGPAGPQGPVGATGSVTSEVTALVGQAANYAAEAEDSATSAEASAMAASNSENAAEVAADDAYLLAAALTNIDGGYPDSIYGGIGTVDAGVVI